MAIAKFLPDLLTCGGCGLKSFRSKKDAATIAAASNESDSAKNQEEMLRLLNNFPESESEFDRELSFSFLLSNSSPEKEKDDVLEEGGKTKDQCKEVAAAKDKKRRRVSRSRSSCDGERIGVLLNLHVPVPYSRSISDRETPCISLAELEKREVEFNRSVGCWPARLRRKQDRNKLQLEVVPQLITC